VNAASVLREARARGIQLSVRGDRLHVKAPIGALDPSLAGPQIAHDGGPIEQCVVCGCPTWWQSTAGIWRCDHCDPRTDTIVRVFVVAGGEWGRH